MLRPASPKMEGGPLSPLSRKAPFLLRRCSCGGGGRGLGDGGSPAADPRNEGRPSVAAKRSAGSRHPEPGRRTAPRPRTLSPTFHQHRPERLLSRCSREPAPKWRAGLRGRQRGAKRRNPASPRLRTHNSVLTTSLACNVLSRNPCVARRGRRNTDVLARQPSALDPRP